MKSQISPRSARRRALALAPVGVALALTLSACGTTVQLGDNAAAASSSSGLGDGLSLDVGLPSASPSQSTAGTSDVAARADTGSTGAGEESTSAPDSGAATTIPGSTGAISTSTKPIDVGFLVSEDAGKALSALGYNGQSSGDGSTQVKAIVDAVNATGGLNGRKINPIIYELTLAGGSSDSQMQAACSMFFDDHHVLAVAGAFSRIVSDCAKKHNVPFSASGLISISKSYLANNPELVMATHPVIEDATTTMVDGLVKQGWFKKNSAAEVVKIGLVTHDDPSYTNVRPIVLARLKAAGLTLTDTTYMPYPNGQAGGEGPAAAAGKSASLKFRAEGINRVISMDEHGFGFGWFALGAGSNGYFPRLGLSSLSLPSFYTSLLSPNQLEGAAGVGWAPYIDTSVPNQPVISPRTTACINAMKKAGENTGLVNVRLSAFSICETVYTLADGWKGTAITLPGFLQGLKAISGKYQPVGVFGANFAKSRAAADKYRVIRYDAGCDCFKYSGADQSFS